MSRAIRAAFVAASLAGAFAPAVASADPEPLCRLHWEKPVVYTDENGVPAYVVVERPQWVC